jgi:predicted DNA-binding transcriptional regulator AlpA
MGFNPAVFRNEVESRGLSMREVSRLSGLHEVSLYNYCSGHTSPSPRSLTKLSMTLARVPRLPINLSGEPEAGK